MIFSSKLPATELMSEFERDEQEEQDDLYASMPREPIPEVLHSFYEERPFVSCTRCGESLSDFKEGFKISKNFKRGEVIVEYALCMPCMEGMMDEASDESKRLIQEFHEERFREDADGFEECSLCEKRKDEARDDEFGLTGICQGDDILDRALVCVDCMEDMAEVISEETRGKWNRFREENFPGVPGDFEPMPDKPTPLLL